MEQRSVVLFLRLNGLSKKAIHREPFVVLQKSAVSHSSVTRFRREAILGLNSEEASSSPKDDGLDEVNDAILLALSDEPFSSIPSVRQISDSPQDMRSKSTVYRPFGDSLHFTVRHQTSLSGSSLILRKSDGKSSQIELSMQQHDLLLPIRHQG
jgi:hypothetical protein